MKVKSKVTVSPAVIAETREWFEGQFRGLEKPITWADLVEKRFRHIVAKQNGKLSELIDDALWLYLAKCKTGISNVIALGEKIDFSEGFEFGNVDFYRSIIRKALRKCTGYAEYTKAYREGLRSQAELHCEYCGDIYDPWLGRKRGTFFTRDELLFSWPLKCQFCGRLLRTPVALKEIEDLIGECSDYADYEESHEATTDEIERGGEEE